MKRWSLAKIQWILVLLFIAFLCVHSWVRFFKYAPDTIRSAGFDWDALKTESSLGELQVDSLSFGLMIFNENEKKVVDSNIYLPEGKLFTSESSYEMKNSAGESFYFRYGFGDYNGKNSSLRQIYWIQPPTTWEKGKYTFNKINLPRIQKGKVKVATIGDTYFWYGDARFFRRDWVTKNRKVSFVGKRIDACGYPHASEGGKSSDDVVRRYSLFSEKADYYIIMLGGNDIVRAPEHTVRNIHAIIDQTKRLYGKGEFRVVTLAPDQREEWYKKRIQELNENIRTESWGDAVKVVDLEGEILKYPDWKERKMQGGNVSKEFYDLLIRLLDESIF